MITNKHTNYVFKELNRVIPASVVSSSLSMIINPQNFRSEYNLVQHDIDQYFMHLSNATSKKTLKQLADVNNTFNPTQYLRLISAKIILGIQEMSRLSNTEAENFLREEKSEWLKYVYYNQGRLAERFK